MKISFHKVLLKKKFPLAISRGVKSENYNVFVKIEDEGIVAWGESSPGNSEGAGSAEEIISQLNRIVNIGIQNKSIYDLERISREIKISPCAYAGLDIALWDLKAKKAKLALHELLGLPLPKSMTSLTIGIMSPKLVKERIPVLFKKSSSKFLKVKLGSTAGLEADKAMYMQVLETSKNYGLKLRVDANGGWSTEDAKYMMNWLADKNCDYVEQPLVEGNEKDLKSLYQSRSLPIFVDESCRFSSDIQNYYDCIDGVNLKLMKCGGITEGLRILSTAKAFGLETMIGCMGESSISISAGASISGQIDHIDLDSHYNLDPDPSIGASMINGITMPRIAFGHGAFLKN